MASSETTRPVAGSKSWRLTPRMRTGRPLMQQLVADDVDAIGIRPSPARRSTTRPGGSSERHVEAVAGRNLGGPRVHARNPGRQSGDPGRGQGPAGSSRPARSPPRRPAACPRRPRRSRRARLAGVAPRTSPRGSGDHAAAPPERLPGGASAPRGRARSSSAADAPAGLRTAAQPGHVDLDTQRPGPGVQLVPAADDDIREVRERSWQRG